MPRPRKALTDIATRHQVLLERLKTQSAHEFSAAIPELQVAISDVLNALQIGDMNELTQRQLQSLLTDLRNEQAKIIEANNKVFAQKLRELSGYETGFEARALAGGTAAALAKMDLVVPTAEQAYSAALKQPLTATGHLLEPFIDTWGDNHIEGVGNAVRRAWGDGKTMGQLMQEIRGTKKLGYKDGLVEVSRRQAEAVARTSVQHVASTARMSLWERNNDIVTGYRWVSTLDSRTSQICRSLDGKTFKLGQGPRPPAHINCRSTTVAELPPEFDFLDEGATRSSNNGYVDANQTYYSWLKGQPEAFQNEALGATRAKLFRDGGLSSEKFAALNIGRNFEPLTLEEMMKREPSVFARAKVTL